MPSLLVNVSFEASAPHVLLRNPSRGVRCSATPEQLDRALTLRGRDIVAAVLYGAREPSLVWIRPASEIPERPSLESTSKHLLSAWADTLRRLAQ